MELTIGPNLDTVARELRRHASAWNAVDFFHRSVFALLLGRWAWKLPSQTSTIMNESQTIEVEVVEIDGATPSAKFPPRERLPLPSPNWLKWLKRLSWIRQLDRRWWPLWAILATVGVFLLLTVGIVVGVILVIFRVLSGVVRAIFR